MAKMGRGGGVKTDIHSFTGIAMENSLQGFGAAFANENSTDARIKGTRASKQGRVDNTR